MMADVYIYIYPFQSHIMMIQIQRLNVTSSITKTQHHDGDYKLGRGGEAHGRYISIFDVL